jgi:twinkle protein
MYQYSAKDIVRKLSDRVEAVVRYLLPNGKKKGNEWCVGSIHGDTGESLKVCLSGDKAGIWSDFATGDKGDLLNLWCACRNVSLQEAITQAKHWLGIHEPAFDPKTRPARVKPQIDSPPIMPSSKAFQYLTKERLLTPETLSKYKILSEKDTIIFPYYQDNQLIMAKYLEVDRQNGKKAIRVTANCEPCLFGWQAIPKAARVAMIVEGEIDAMTADQYGLEVAVFSVPFGGGGKDKQRWVEYEFDRLSGFDEILLCLDQDPEGQAAIQELTDRLGRHRCRVVSLPYKDMNECLQSGVTREAIQKCLVEAKNLDPKELKQAADYVDKVIDGFYPSDNSVSGYYFPWAKTNENIQMRFNELSMWTGINGHGKSQLLGNVVLDVMRQGGRVCIASLELTPKKLLMRLTRQAGALRQPTSEYIKEIHQWYQDRLWVFEIVGTAKTKNLLEVFLYARQRYGIDVFVIDSLMKCGLGEDDYNGQKLFVEQLCDFKNEHDCHIHLVVHPRKGSSLETKPKS